MITVGNDCVYPQISGKPYDDSLTKREYFAALAMSGLIAGAEFNPTADELAEHSVLIADALIKELNK